MESVVEKIREAQLQKIRNKAEAHTMETVIDDCQVKIRFDPTGDNNIMKAIQRILISAHMDTAFSSSSGGECA